jgi:hypothetical protein
MTNIVLYILLPIVGTVMLLMVMDNKIKGSHVFQMFWAAFKGETPRREDLEERAPIRDYDDYRGRFDPADWGLYRNKGFEHDYEKVNWQEEGF